MRKVFITVLVTAVSVSACGTDAKDSAAGAGGGDPVQAEGAAAEGVAADPVRVTMVASEPLPAAESVGPDGAVLTRTGPDGTTYELHIPAGALVRPTDIEVAPLARLDGLPDDTELAFGVQLEPDGLVFARPAWLYVDPADDASVDVTAGLAVEDDEASLRPIGFDGERYVVPVAHFSGRGGVGFPGPGGFGGWPDRMPSNPGSADLQGGAIDLGGPVDVPTPGDGFPPTGPPPAGSEGDSSSGAPTGHGSLTEGYDPNGSSGGGDDFSGEVGDALEDIAYKQLTGDDEGAQKKIDELGERLRGHVDEIARVCIEEKDLTKLGELLYWQMVGQLVGFDNPDGEMEYQEQLIAACNRFEMETYGEFMFELGGVFRMGDSITTTVPLEMEGLGHEGSANGPVTGVGYDRGVEVLELMAQGIGALAGIEVPNDITQNDYIQCSLAPGTGDVGAVAAGLISGDDPIVNVTLGTVAEIGVTCPDPIGYYSLPPFVVDLEGMREAGLPGVTDGGLLLQEWQLSDGGNPVATKELHHQVSEQGASITIGWHFTINHTPGKMPTRP